MKKLKQVLSVVCNSVMIVMQVLVAVISLCMFLFLFYMIPVGVYELALELCVDTETGLSLAILSETIWLAFVLYGYSDKVEW